MGAIISGLGISVPDSILTNADLEKKMDTTDEWIVSRTGIRERRILPENDPRLASDLGAEALTRALQAAGLSPLDLDGIIVGAIVPDKQFPATACFIQEKVGAKNAFAFDITAACAGFVFGANLASQFIQSGQCKHVAVLGAETLSRAVDWTDRNTCILFGDASAAAIFSAGPNDRGIIVSKLKSDGAHAGILFWDGRGGGTGMNMDGRQVFKLAVSEVSSLVVETLAGAGFVPQDLDLLVLHQANVRILSAIGERLGLPSEKVVINVDRYGNTSSSSIPLALHEAHAEGRLQPGMLVALAGVGGGMSWGCNLMRW
jgi:3-oxoacyl-[acyl-carrier-protein] synthase-3